ncbi:MAG: glycosyltransferase family 2 protein [Bacteroidales bacterium]|nr:glycosyltransferase family 2 protein [Bacteroidales bacterium]
MELSVVIISWNAQRYVRPCLQSVVKAVSSLSAEVIFIDNGSQDETEQIVTTEFPSVVYRNLHANRGVAAARNVGMKMAQGDYILLLDIDTVANAESIQAMLELMKQQPEVGVCSCKLTSAADEPQLSCLKMPTLTLKIKNVLLVLLIKAQKAWSADFLRRWGERLWDSNKKYFYLEQMDGSEPFDCEYLIGACQCIRAKLLDKVGYLDEKIFYGPEDADFCLRVWHAGSRVTYIPTVSIIHHYQKITNKKLFSRMSRRHVNALFYFFWKHKRLFRTGV